MGGTEEQSRTATADGAAARARGQRCQLGASEDQEPERKKDCTGRSETTERCIRESKKKKRVEYAALGSDWQRIPFAFDLSPTRPSHPSERPSPLSPKTHSTYPRHHGQSSMPQLWLAESEKQRTDADSSLPAQSNTPTDWEIRFSKSRRLPYFYSPSTTTSVWEAPPSLTPSQIQDLPGAHHLRPVESADAPGGGGAGVGPERVRASHLLVKHRGSRRPSSWKEVSLAFSHSLWQSRPAMSEHEGECRGLLGKALVADDLPLHASPPQANITRSKEEAITILEGYEDLIRNDMPMFPELGQSSRHKPIATRRPSRTVLTPPTRFCVHPIAFLSALTLSDCSSHSASGDLGFFTRGQMQKPFEDATFRLKVGELSNIVSTDSGVHLILRTA